MLYTDRLAKTGPDLGILQIGPSRPAVSAEALLYKSPRAARSSSSRTPPPHRPPFQEGPSAGGGVSAIPPLRPCLGLPGQPPCRRLSSTGSRCVSCKAAYTKARDARRGSPTQRGLGAQHRAQVQALVDAAGGTPTHCPRCNKPITKSNPITGQHDQARAHGGTHVTSLLCRTCNSSLGARIRRTNTTP